MTEPMTIATSNCAITIWTMLAAAVVMTIAAMAMLRVTPDEGIATFA